MKLTTTPQTRTKNYLETENQLEAGKIGRTLATAGDIDELLSDARRALLCRLENAGTIRNAVLILQCDI